MIVALGACERSVGGDERLEVIDSAGVQVVRHNRLDDDGPVFLVDSLKLLGDGRGQAGLEFASVGDLDVLHDERIAVLDGRNSRVCIFSPHGDLESCIGREGEGPGEFNGALTLAILPLPDGGFAVPDAGNGRLTVFSKEGEVAGTLPFPTEGSFAPEWRGWGDGRVAFRRVSASVEEIVVGSLAMNDPRIVASLPRIVHGPESGDGRWPLLADWYSWDVDPRGRVVVARTSESRFTVIQSGAAARVVSWDAPRTPPTPEDVETLLQITARAAGSPSGVPPELRASMAAPPWKPPLAAVRWGPRGLVLVQTVRATGEMDARVLSTMRSEGRGGRVWRVFRDDGSFAGSLVFDANVEIFRVRGDQILGAREDPSGAIAPFRAPWPEALRAGAPESALAPES